RGEEQDGLGRRRIHALHGIKFERQRATVFQLSYPISENLCAHLSHTTDLEVKPATANFPLILTPRGPQPDVETAERTGGFQGGGRAGFQTITQWRTRGNKENRARRGGPTLHAPPRHHHPT